MSSTNWVLVMIKSFLRFFLFLVLGSSALGTEQPLWVVSLGAEKVNSEEFDVVVVALTKEKAPEGFKTVYEGLDYDFVLGVAVSSIQLVSDFRSQYLRDRGNIGTDREFFNNYFEDFDETVELVSGHFQEAILELGFEVYKSKLLSLYELASTKLKSLEINLVHTSNRYFRLPLMVERLSKFVAIESMTAYGLLQNHFDSTAFLEGVLASSKEIPRARMTPENFRPSAVLSAAELEELPTISPVQIEILPEDATSILSRKPLMVSYDTVYNKMTGLNVTEYSLVTGKGVAQLTYGSKGNEMFLETGISFTDNKLMIPELSIELPFNAQKQVFELTYPDGEMVQFGELEQLKLNLQSHPGFKVYLLNPRSAETLSNGKLIVVMRSDFVAPGYDSDGLFEWELLHSGSFISPNSAVGFAIIAGSHLATSIGNYHDASALAGELRDFFALNIISKESVLNTGTSRICETMLTSKSLNTEKPIIVEAWPAKLGQSPFVKTEEKSLKINTSRPPGLYQLKTFNSVYSQGRATPPISEPKKVLTEQSFGKKGWIEFGITAGSEQ